MLEDMDNLFQRERQIYTYMIKLLVLLYSRVRERERNNMFRI